MASQDHISQFSQGIPSTQPDRSPSRTPRRDIGSTPHETSVPTFRGPLHMATAHYRHPNFGYNPTWTPPRLPLTPSSTTPPSLHWPSMQPTGYPTQPLLPPMPPTQSPPPPPPQATMTPQRFTTTSPKSHSSTPPSSMSQIQKGYPVRPCEIPAMTNWKPDVDFHDVGKVNGIDFPTTVRSSKFSQFKDIEGMDPLQIPLWKFLYQGLNNTWLRRIAHGRDVYVLPFDNIGTTVFIAELVQQLKSRNLDLDRLASYRCKQQGVLLQQKEATQHMAKEVAQIMQSWLPAPTAPDPSSQQRILDLEAQLATLKGQQSSDAPTTGSAPTGSATTVNNLQHRLSRRNLC